MRYKSAIGTCPDCRMPLWWDDESGEAIPHDCPMDYIETAQATFWAEMEDDNG